MSRYLSPRLASLVPYTPGEQPRERRYIKLNTNESPFPPSPRALAGAREAAARAELYPDPTMKALREAIAGTLGVAPECVLPTNGSDEILSYAFCAFCDKETPAVFPDVTYGFYSVFATLYGVPYRTVPLKEDLTLDPRDYAAAGGTVFIANPNAPTGLALSLREVEEIVRSNRENVVVIDEAYVDFGAESAVSLTKKYENLLVTQTFSKSRSMAGARLGFGVASPALIRDLDTVKYSQNPYNVNAMSAAMGIGALADAETFAANCRAIIKTRAYTAGALGGLGFEVIPSLTNFLFVRHPSISGADLYTALRERGILVRHFTSPRIADYNRITVGSQEEMEALVAAAEAILEETK
ncbi:MAG: histidinol-phosphate transaminase [Clostridia bacterium]|nr:histidinol-phosphate transaminase [Clostridia bacterium]